MARPTKTIKKTDAIIVRVTGDFKTQVEMLAELSRRELSDYVRLLLEDAIKERRKI